MRVTLSEKKVNEVMQTYISKFPRKCSKNIRQYVKCRQRNFNVRSDS